MSPRCDSVESGQATNLPESSMPSAKLNGLSHSKSQSSLLSNQNTEVESEDAGVPRLLVEAGFALFLMTFLVEKHYWFWLAISFIVFRFFYSNLGRRCLKTLPRDLKGLYTLFRVKFIIKMAMRRNLPLHHYFLEHMRANPNAECVVDIETGRTFTFVEFNKLANKYANFYRSRGYKKDDVVALFVENSPEFFAIWLGLSKLGVITAWINTNLKMEPLGYSIKVSKAKSIITSSRLLTNLETAINEGHLENSLKTYLIDGNNNGHDNLAELIKDESEPPMTPGLHFQSILCYIYTSGTTGNPKPAVIKHFRYYWICVGCSRAFGLSPKDRVYVTMPMYHSAAGILGVGQVFASGATIVIRKKFSASNFWKDCVKYRCTASQYIGEIARYLLAQKPCPEERMHNVWIMFGNGFRGEIWPEFVRRFGVKIIGEFYGSTEGNSNIVNLDSHVGACGFFPIYPFLTILYPVRLLKVDPESGELLRDENGLCITCRPGDMGEMVGVIKENDPLLRFEGYLEKGDTQKKIIRDVCKKGDAVFSSGDVLFWDKLGYLYFKDRRGDTYRWRGENVSTMEVEGILQPIMEIEDATVYGVEVPGREGRAGMIGVALRDDANVNHFLTETARRLTDNLASYAIPVFLRICKEVDKTGTFKLKKTVLQKDGFDLEKCHGDPIYFWDVSEIKYKLMDQEMQEKIETGEYSKI